uniref:Transporter n=1 Tax=Meloidogyne incognita TaxID=6306 RepID=A0A914NDK7_MELIC
MESTSKITTHERAQWSSDWQFILTCIGYAVGLGNLWRFPSLAYEHGGGAFLIPYLICSFIVGLPLLHLEMSLGQFSQSGTAVVYGRIRPLFHGIGWSMSAMSLIVSVYYNVILAWVLIYLWTIVTGRSGEWASCRNDYNTIYCQSTVEDSLCIEEFAQKSQNVLAFYFNKSCHSDNDIITKNLKTETFNKLSAVSPAEEFFENYVLEKTLKLDQFGGINLKVALALAIAWTLTGLVLVKGVKMMGKISYFTATIPYVIIVILFIRGITLDGASIGLDYYIFHPDFSVILDPVTWRAAATQVCYSLSVGFGGILSLSSYNPRTHNCYRDAFIITMADGFMSIFGGTAVFSVLGFMSKQLNAKIQTVVQSGTGLAFIAYPEAMSRMPLPWLWSFLFFLMLFILGISSQFGLAEVMITAIYDQFPAVRPYRGWLAVGVCGSLFLVGLIMCTRSGIFFFNIFNDYSASFSLLLMVILEIILIIYIYGLPNFLDDLRSMFGYPRTWLGRIFGPTGYYIQGIWCFLAPLQITEVISASKFQICSYSYSYFVPPLFLASYSYSYLVPPLF